VSTIDIVVAIAIVVALAAGFWWTRGGGGVPGGIDDPARQQLTKYTQLGHSTPWDPRSPPETVSDPKDISTDEPAPPMDPHAEDAASARERDRYRQKYPDWRRRNSRSRAAAARSR